MKRLLVLSLLGVFALGLMAESSPAAPKPKKKPDLDAIFKRLDKDGDGKLTLEEFVGKRTGEKKERAEKTFKRLDKNGDGSLSLEEFKTRKKKKKSDS